MGGGKSPSGYHNEYNRNENVILCSSSGANAGYISKYSCKIWASDCFSIHSKNIEIIDEKYLYYFLKNTPLIRTNHARSIISCKRGNRCLNRLCHAHCRYKHNEVFWIERYHGPPAESVWA